jgi:hypothetical protein
MDESRALQRAGWAGAASIVLLVVGVALGYLVGVDDASMSDAAILERLNDDARQVAAGVGMPVLAAGIALLLWFATGLRRVLDRMSGGDPLAHAIVPAAALFGVMVAVTARIAQQARALPTWAVCASYGVAGLSLTGFWSGGMASVAFALWLICAVIGVLRAARRAPSAQGAPAPTAASG